MEDPILSGSSFGPGRVVDILGASGASDSGSNPDRGVHLFTAEDFMQEWPAFPAGQ
jgi:hypothetical protein